MPFFAIEPIRERRYGRPLLLVREPLANFAITIESSRDETADQNMQVQILLAQTFLTDSNFTDAFHRQMWDAAGGSRGHTHRALIVAAILASRLARVLKSARLADLAFVAGWALRHPVHFARLFTAGRTFPHVLEFLARAIMIANGVSVIVPTIGRPESLTRLLDSLARQSRQPDEVIVSDGSHGPEVARVVTQPAWTARGLNVKRIAVQPPNAVSQRVAAIADSRGEEISAWVASF